MSDYPHLATSIDWETTTMEDYQKNTGRLKIGENYWNINQEFKSFATLEDQELLSRFNISSQSADVEISFLFHHRVRTKAESCSPSINVLLLFQANFEDIYNKLALRISEQLWFEVYALQDYTESPFRNYLEGGLSYPGRSFKGIFNMSESLEESQEFEGNLMLQLQSDQRLESKFVIANSERFSGFFISSVIETTDNEPIAFQACGYILTCI